MSSQEAKTLQNFLLAPAALRDFMTLQQFTEIFPPVQRSSSVIKELYAEISALRQEDIDHVQRNIKDEVKRSKKLQREYRSERRLRDHANVAGLDPVTLQTEEELSVCACLPINISRLTSEPALPQHTSQQTPHTTNYPSSRQGGLQRHRSTIG